MINLGDTVREIITGFEGIAIQRLENLFGPTEIKVQQRNLNGDERPFDPMWFAESQLERKGKPIHFEKQECLIEKRELDGHRHDGKWMQE